MKAILQVKLYCLLKKKKEIFCMMLWYIEILAGKIFLKLKKLLKNIFIESVKSISYDNFLIALKKLKIVKDDYKKNRFYQWKILNDDEMVLQRQKILIKLNAKAQHIFSLLQFVILLVNLSYHNLVLIINILISMIISGIISLVYIFFIIF